MLHFCDLGPHPRSHPSILDKFGLDSIESIVFLLQNISINSHDRLKRIYFYRDLETNNFKIILF
jgi:hypothetical protein